MKTILLRADCESIGLLQAAALIAEARFPNDERSRQTCERWMVNDLLAEAASGKLTIRNPMSMRPVLPHAHKSTPVFEFAASVCIARNDFIAIAIDNGIEVQSTTTVRAAPAEATPAVTAKTAKRLRDADLLAPVVRSAQLEAEDPDSAAQVFNVLRNWANQRRSCLLGVTSNGIQWMDSHDEQQELTLAALRERLRRARKANTRPPANAWGHTGAHVK